MERYVALLPTLEPLAGQCPACDGIMDETRCRIGKHLISRDVVRSRGIAQVVEVFCTGAPTTPPIACPACQ
jgi:hypothetical protein